MAADFCYMGFRNRANTLDPQTAIAALQASTHHSLREAVFGTGHPSRWINLCTYPDNNNSAAVLMQGESGELQAALAQATTEGIDGFWSTGDELHVWFLRRKAGFSTKTVVLVMPCDCFLQPSGTGANKVTHPSLIYGMQSWAQLYCTPNNRTDSTYAGLPMTVLSQKIGGTHGGQAWV